MALWAGVRALSGVKCERSEHEKPSGFEGKLVVCLPGETSSTILSNYWVWAHPSREAAPCGY